MALPKKRKSKARRNMRQAANDRIAVKELSVCPSCGEQKLPHRICPACGFYKDRVVVQPRDKTSNA
jgi:large subunit ribosomal protein L32